jgi:hypothetical protein
MSVRFHPAALVTLACLVLALVSSLQLPSPLQFVHVAAIACLVSPLLLLLWAHQRLAKNWRHHAWLVLCAVPLAYLSYVAAFLMGWFKAGWYGVAVFTVLLFVLAACSLLPLRRKRGEADAV